MRARGVTRPVNTDFRRALQQCLDRIPPGRVATCGAIARALGDVRASRAVAAWIVECGVPRAVAGGAEPPRG
ncbi:MAG: MGMT family protein [Methanobacteriota archaeon]|nr:MAG: MGMT family protein [Euryarchaeota archaeon]